MKAAKPLPAPPTVAARFRSEIEQAMSEGAALDDLTLHLTPGNLEQLKRDRAVAVADISFAGGAMTYLGVKILKGSGPSALDRRDPA